MSDETVALAEQEAELRDRLDELEEEKAALEADLRQALPSGDPQALRTARDALDRNRGERAEIRGLLDEHVGPLIRERQAEDRLQRAAELLPASDEAREAREADYVEQLDAFSPLRAFNQGVEATEDEHHRITAQRAARTVLAEMLDLEVPEFEPLPQLDRNELRDALDAARAGLDRSPFRSDPEQLLRQSRRGRPERREAAARQLAELAGGDVGDAILEEIEARTLERELAAESEGNEAER